MQEPYIIDLQKIGEEEIGYISVAQAFSNVPFEIKRVYWIYGTPETVERGNHAHRDTLQIVFCLTGKIKITLESTDRKPFEFVLDNPNQGLFIPKRYWSKLNFYDNSIGVCLSSLEYDESDYIRNYNEFFKHKVI